MLATGLDSSMVPYDEETCCVTNLESLIRSYRILLNALLHSTAQRFEFGWQPWLALWIDDRADLSNRIVYVSRMSLDKGSDVCKTPDISSSYEFSVNHVKCEQVFLPLWLRDSPALTTLAMIWCLALSFRSLECRVASCLMGVQTLQMGITESQCYLQKNIIMYTTHGSFLLRVNIRLSYTSLVPSRYAAFPPLTSRS